MSDKKSNEKPPVMARIASMGTSNKEPPPVPSRTSDTCSKTLRRNSDLVSRTFPAIFEKEATASEVFDANIEPMPSPATAAAPLSRPGAFPMPGMGRSSLPSETSTELVSEIDEPIMRRRSTMSALDASLVESGALALAENDDDREAQERSKALEATPLPDRTNDPNETDCIISKAFLFGCLFVWVAGAVALILALVLETESNNSNHHHNPPTKSPTFLNYPPYDYNLKGETLTAIRDDPTSPQYKANAWMLQDPLLATYPQWRQTQRFAMVVKYFATQGDDWFHNDHWLSYDVPECDWWTASNENPCNDQGELVIEDLRNNNLNGTIPMEAPMLSLRYIDNSHNHLHGLIPPVFQVYNCEVFIMSHNEFAGPMVGYVGFDAPSMRILKLDGNQFEFDHVGILFALFPQLEVFNATGNPFGGSLPTKVDNPYLRYLGLGHTFIEGALPSELGLLTALEELDVSDNPQISGSIPTELALLHNLTYLDVAGTALSGAVPEELCTRADNDLQLVANCSQLQCCN